MSLLATCVAERRFPHVPELAALYEQHAIQPRGGVFLDWVEGDPVNLCGCPVGLLVYDHDGPRSSSDLPRQSGYGGRLLAIVSDLGAGAFVWGGWSGALMAGFDGMPHRPNEFVRSEGRAGFSTGSALRSQFITEGIAV